MPATAAGYADPCLPPMSLAHRLLPWRRHPEHFRWTGSHRTLRRRVMVTGQRVNCWSLDDNYTHSQNTKQTNKFQHQGRRESQSCLHEAPGPCCDLWCRTVSGGALKPLVTPKISLACSFGLSSGHRSHEIIIRFGDSTSVDQFLTPGDCSCPLLYFWASQECR